MIDHVTVRLDFLVSQIGIVHSKIGDPDWRNLHKNVMRFGFRNMPNAIMDKVGSLKASGVAYDYSWGRSLFLNSGGHSTRFSPDGELIYKDLIKSDLNLNVESIYKYTDDPDLLKRIIKAAYERQCILPWDNQEEYGKLYMARQLVAPKKG